MGKGGGEIYESTDCITIAGLTGWKVGCSVKNKSGHYNGKGSSSTGLKRHMVILKRHQIKVLKKIHSNDMFLTKEIGSLS